VAGVLPIVPARLAAGALRVILRFAARMRCRFAARRAASISWRNRSISCWSRSISCRCFSMRRSARSNAGLGMNSTGSGYPPCCCWFAATLHPPYSRRNEGFFQPCLQQTNSIRVQARLKNTRFLVVLAAEAFRNKRDSVQRDLLPPWRPGSGPSNHQMSPKVQN